MPKRILIFVDWFYPGYKAGGPITSVKNLIDHLHTDAEFLVVTRDHDYLSTEPYDGIKSDQWIDMERFSAYYISHPNVNRKTIQKIISETEFDLAYINGIYSKFFSILPIRPIRKKNKPIIIAVRGMLAKTAIGIKSFKKKLFLRYARATSLYRNVIFHATNSDERSDILDVIPKAKVIVSPNLPVYIKHDMPHSKEKVSGELKLLFLGRVAPEKNTLFAIQSLSGCTGKVVLDIVGSVYNPDYWDDCSKAIESLPENVQVNYLGSMNPSEIPSLLQQYHFLYLPTKGENFGHAIIESILSGVPVVISEKTPWTYLKDGKGFIVDIHSKEKTSAVLNVITSIGQEQYNELLGNIRRFAQDYVQNNEGISLNKELFGLN